MLNNKYLAIVLSVVAVAVLVFQIFFNKEKKPVRQPEPAVGQQVTPRPQQAAPPQMEPSMKDGSAGTAGAGAENAGDDGLIIDYNSPMLLDRVYEMPMERFMPRELPQRYGNPIFSVTLVTSTPAGYVTGEGKEKEIQFKLNAIIMDRERRLAVINGTIVKAGELVNGALVTNIGKKRVMLKYNDTDIVLSTESRIKTIKLVGGTGEN